MLARYKQNNGLFHPWRELFDLQKEFDSIFGCGDESCSKSNFYPELNVEDNESSYKLSVSLPGCKSEEIDVQLLKGKLTIKAEKKAETEEDHGKCKHRERFSGNFSQEITLPEGLDYSKAEAELKDGILSLNVPKAEKEKPYTIKVN